MMKIKPFEFQGCTVRSFEENGIAWFVARDVAVYLQYTNPQKAVTDHCKGVTKRYIPTAGGEQEMTVIPERDVYRLVMRSKMPKAEEFEEFIMGTVVPQVVRTGKYLPHELTRLELIELARDAEIGRLKAEQKIALDAPKVEAHDRFMQAENTQTVRQVGKLFGLGDKTFFRLMREYGILMKNNLPYQHHIDAGRFKVIQKPFHLNDEIKLYPQTVFTAKGIDWVSTVIDGLKVEAVS